MFTNLGGFFGIRPRQAENADTRQEIRRHDPDQQKQQKHEKNEDKPVFETYDNATVSLDALKIFLQNFLHTQTLEDKSVKSPVFSPDSRESQPGLLPLEDKVKAASAEASRATHAYQAFEKQPARFHNSTTPNIHTPVLPPEDVRLIHTLLIDIETLKARGIHQLAIEKDVTFLASLAQATRKALAL